jgi:hypothetical protein
VSDPADLTVSPSDSDAGLALVAPEASEKERRRQETMRFYGDVTMEEFAGRFGLTGCDPVKTLKRWIDKGRGVSPADLPPYQRPHELAAWWRRMQAAGVMGKKPPEWMVLLEQAGPTGQAAAAAVATPETVPAAAPAAEGKASAAVVSDHTPEFALPVLDGDAGAGEKELLEFAKGWLDEMEAAKRAKDSKRFYRAWNEYKSLNKELRAWQKDRQRERLANGDLMEAEKEKEALGIIFAAMGKTFTSAIEVVVSKWRPDLDPVGRRALVVPFRDQIFSALKGSKFERVLQHEELRGFLAA